MIQQTKGIVLRVIKYGETSLICNIFTRTYGVQSYLLQGVRSAKSRQNKTAFLQPASLLDLVVYQKPTGNLQRIKELLPDYIYTSLQEEVVKNSIALFSVEMLLRLLPEAAPAPELYDFSRAYFEWVDRLPVRQLANFPLFFVIQCGRFLGYNVNGRFSEETPYLSFEDGAFTAIPPETRPLLSSQEAAALDKILLTENITQLGNIEMNAAMRTSVLDWYLEFLHRHTQHLGQIKSLAILRAILH